MKTHKRKTRSVNTKTQTKSSENGEGRKGWHQLIRHAGANHGAATQDRNPTGVWFCISNPSSDNSSNLATCMLICSPARPPASACMINWLPCFYN